MSDKSFTREKTLKFAENAASRNGWVLNPDRDFLDSVVDGLFGNYEQFGYLLCPCRESWEDREKDRDVICPCSYAADDIDEYGHCYCGLYMSEKFAGSGEYPGSIPERRNPELIP